MNKVLALIVLGVALTAFVLSYPASAACVFAQENAYSDSQREVLQNARARIESKFGVVSSLPTVYFFEREDMFWPLKLNLFGSTSFLGYKTCVAIGPYGKSTDVVAHELMHAEVEKITGFWARLTRIPTWFDEGLAMQVDFRDRYNLRHHENTAFVRALDTGKKFFVADREQLIRHYAAAKSEVNTWLDGKEAGDVLQKLSTIKSGESFDAIWNSTQ